MYCNERSARTARNYRITRQLRDLEKDIMRIEYVEKIEFDLDSLISWIPYIIIIPKFHVPVESETYFEDYRRMVTDIIQTANKHGLRRTVDRIEDMGAHLYMVFRTDWVKFPIRESAPFAEPRTVDTIMGPPSAREERRLEVIYKMDPDHVVWNIGENIGSDVLVPVCYPKNRTDSICEIIPESVKVIWLEPRKVRILRKAAGCGVISLKTALEAVHDEHDRLHRRLAKISLPIFQEITEA